LPEGITLDPDTGVTVPVTFTPTVPGSLTADYKFDAVNNQGWMTVTFRGTGTLS
jgi:hypothetical protein